MAKQYVRLYPIDIERMPWQRIPGGAAGTAEKVLAYDAADGSATRLIRALPGTEMGIFQHEHWEEVYILEGSARLGEEYHTTGTYTCKPPCIDHGPIWTLEGFVNLECRDFLAPAIRKPFTRLYTVDIQRMAWQDAGEGEPGVSVKRLAYDPGTGSETLLWRVAPGAELPARVDERCDETYILEGSCKLSDEFYPAGTYLCLPAGATRGALYTAEGLLALSVRNRG